jgi:uncharacterized protein YyaL (SSP411 family)
LLISLGYLNAHFASPSGGFNLTRTPPSSKSDLVQNDLEGEPSVPIMTLKPGSDNALPSPNGIIASNLLLLSSYLEDPSYRAMAKRTIDAFAIEIIQHPFLFVSMLSAVVLEAVGVKSVVVAGPAVVDHLGGFGRTVIRLYKNHGQEWLVARNELLSGITREGGENGRVMICEAGTCRELKDEDLDARGGEHND